jgi:hypothetical protein
MPSIRNAARHRLLQGFVWALFGTLWAVGLVACMLTAAPNASPLVPGLVGSVVMLACWWSVRRWLDKRFRCPCCGGPVEAVPTPKNPHGDPEGDPVYKLCKRCDILWQVGTV